MIFTITMNPAIDKTIQIPNFSIGAVNRIEMLRLDAGGKGINVSKCLSALGQSSVAGVLLGGETGKLIQELLTDDRITLVPVEIARETRTNIKIVDQVRKENTDINEAGPMVYCKDTDALKKMIKEQISTGDILILSGSLPRGIGAGLYGTWISEFRSLGVRVFLDASGEALKEGVKNCPFFIKPNREELSGLIRQPIYSAMQCAEAAQSLIREGIENVIVSMGADGALFASRNENWFAKAPTVKVSSTVGAGDSMVAAMAYGLEHHMENKEILRLAIAMGTASVTCDGTQAPTLEDVTRLIDEIEIQEVFS